MYAEPVINTPGDHYQIFLFYGHSTVSQFKVDMGRVQSFIFHTAAVQILQGTILQRIDEGVLRNYLSSSAIQDSSIPLSFQTCAQIIRSRQFL